MIRIRKIELLAIGMALLLLLMGARWALQNRAEQTEYQIVTPGVDDHVVYRLNETSGEVCRMDFLEKAVRCGAEKTFHEQQVRSIK